MPNYGEIFISGFQSGMNIRRNVEETRKMIEERELRRAAQEDLKAAHQHLKELERPSLVASQAYEELQTRVLSGEKVRPEEIQAAFNMMVLQKSKYLQAANDYLMPGQLSSNPYVAEKVNGALKTIGTQLQDMTARLEQSNKIVADLTIAERGETAAMERLEKSEAGETSRLKLRIGADERMQARGIAAEKALQRERLTHAEIMESMRQRFESGENALDREAKEMFIRMEGDIQSSLQGERLDFEEWKTGQEHVNRMVEQGFAQAHEADMLSEELNARFDLANLSHEQQLEVIATTHGYDLENLEVQYGHDIGKMEKGLQQDLELRGVDFKNEMQLIKRRSKEGARYNYRYGVKPQTESAERIARMQEEGASRRQQVSEEGQTYRQGLSIAADVGAQERELEYRRWSDVLRSDDAESNRELERELRAEDRKLTPGQRAELRTWSRGEATEEFDDMDPDTLKGAKRVWQAWTGKKLSDGQFRDAWLDYRALLHRIDAGSASKGEIAKARRTQQALQEAREALANSEKVPEQSWLKRLFFGPNGELIPQGPLLRLLNSALGFGDDDEDY